jgi:hypothetical protein
MFDVTPLLSEWLATAGFTEYEENPTLCPSGLARGQKVEGAWKLFQGPVLGGRLV